MGASFFSGQMVLYRKRKIRCHHRKQILLLKPGFKEELTGSNLSTTSSSKAKGSISTVCSDSDSLVSMQRRSLTKNVVGFQLTTKSREGHQLITSAWTPLASSNKNVNQVSKIASAQQRLLHRLQLTRSVHDLMSDLLHLCTDNSIDSFTALIVLSLFVLKGTEATMKEIQGKEYIEIEEFPGLRRIPNAFPPYSAWEHLKDVLRISTAFFALPQPLANHFELLDTMEFKFQVEPLILNDQFAAETNKRHLHYKAVQAILLDKITRGCTLNQLLVLLDDLCRFQHLSLKSAMMILTAFLTTGAEAASKMISLGVAVDCSEMAGSSKPLESDLWISPVNKQRRLDVLFHASKFLRVEERLRLSQLCTETRKLIHSPAFEELALQEILWLTSGHLNAETEKSWQHQGEDLTHKINSWHLLGAIMISHLRRFLGKFNDLVDLQNWLLRLDGLLSTACWRLEAHDIHHCANVTLVDVVAERFRQIWMELKVRPDPPLFAIKALLCDTHWREAILDAQNSSITPVMVFKWASGALAEGNGPDGLPSTSEALRNYPQVTQLDDKQLWSRFVEYACDTGDSDSQLNDFGRVTRSFISHWSYLPRLMQVCGCFVEVVQRQPSLCFRIVQPKNGEWHDFTPKPL
eukprot:Gregarina_sp_Poly_1__4738@NODE_252_length_10633_cov_239_890119_g220_i0_p3_GENE_NODE_252_length_10633_cov_239_890119_g220_i0NODE_252_length_10633_cov_239_890119_g220_i0_p3_ORF_typecomplete_len635_score78_76Fbox/PF00646_33/0_62Fboxlike/PF12937_7/60Fboxlike/PF12937_7/1e03Fboxlike/PF12937_7/3e03Fboxlike/PF12937_7/77_NODE_252_length_10633_cov_239_890119_g220_i0867010574